MARPKRTKGKAGNHPANTGSQERARCDSAPPHHPRKRALTSLQTPDHVLPSVGREYASVAQLVERLICNQQVVGSSPTGGSMGSLIQLPRGYPPFIAGSGAKTLPAPMPLWCNGSTSAFQAEDAGSIPVSGSMQTLPRACKPASSGRGDCTVMLRHLGVAFATEKTPCPCDDGCVPTRREYGWGQHRAIAKR